MAILKYKDEDGFWQELPVGTNIAANPPLAGTEANLTGLQVDDTTYKVPVAGEKVSITVPQGATNGTITGEQLAKLQENEANYIEMVNDKELYYLNDNGHVDGYLTYSHVGIENSKATIKTLTITVSAKSFVIVTTVVPTDAGGGKLYKNSIAIVTVSSGGNIVITYLDSQPLIDGGGYTEKTVDEIVNILFGGYNTAAIKTIVDTHRSGPPPTSMGSTSSTANGILAEIYASKESADGGLIVTTLVSDGEKVGTQIFNLTGTVTALYISEEI